jgi:alkyl hydroperoxide reductase subunit AhpC
MNFDDQYIVARVNGKAPDFTANAYNKGQFETVSLYEDVLNKGKWAVVFFYPLDFTFVCPTEIKEFSAKAKAFKDAGAELIGVSVDSEHSHKAWCEGDLGALEFPLVSDLSKDISISYDVLHDDGMSLRGTFIIDPDGVIQHATINNLPLGRNVDETLRTLIAAQSGELCPVGWQKGEETLGKA